LLWVDFDFGSCERSNAYFLISIQSCRHSEDNSDMKKKILGTKKLKDWNAYYREYRN